MGLEVLSFRVDPFAPYSSVYQPLHHIELDDTFVLVVDVERMKPEKRQHLLKKVLEKNWSPQEIREEMQEAQLPYALVNRQTFRYWISPGVVVKHLPQCGELIVVFFSPDDRAQVPAWFEPLCRQFSDTQLRDILFCIAGFGDSSKQFVGQGARRGRPEQEEADVEVPRWLQMMLVVVVIVFCVGSLVLQGLTLSKVDQLAATSKTPLATRMAPLAEQRPTMSSEPVSGPAAQILQPDTGSGEIRQDPLTPGLNPEASRNPAVQPHRAETVTKGLDTRPEGQPAARIIPPSSAKKVPREERESVTRGR